MEYENNVFLWGTHWHSAAVLYILFMLEMQKNQNLNDWNFSVVLLNGTAFKISS